MLMASRPSAVVGLGIFAFFFVNKYGDYSGNSADKFAILIVIHLFFNSANCVYVSRIYGVILSVAKPESF